MSTQRYAVYVLALTFVFALFAKTTPAVEASSPIFQVLQASELPSNLVFSDSHARNYHHIRNEQFVQATSGGTNYIVALNANGNIVRGYLVNNGKFSTFTIAPTHDWLIVDAANGVLVYALNSESLARLVEAGPAQGVSPAFNSRTNELIYFRNNRAIKLNASTFATTQTIELSTVMTGCDADPNERADLDWAHVDRSGNYLYALYTSTNCQSTSVGTTLIIASARSGAEVSRIQSGNSFWLTTYGDKIIVYAAPGGDRIGVPAYYVIQNGALRTSLEGDTLLPFSNNIAYDNHHRLLFEFLDNWRTLRVTNENTPGLDQTSVALAPLYAKLGINPNNAFVVNELQKMFFVEGSVVTAVPLWEIQALLTSQPAERGDCVIPSSGPWPPCATGGARPAPPSNGGCVIPSSGPWPSCATGGQPSSEPSCVIPPSGPWPACARMLDALILQ